MINYKFINLGLSFFVSSSALADNQKNFHGQTVESLATTIENENITNTFVDAKNTVWVSTSTGKIEYKLGSEKEFKAIDLGFEQKNTNAKNINFCFVNTNYTNDATFYIFQNSIGNADASSAIIKISYNANTPVAETYNPKSFNQITAMWADDRGILVAATDTTSKAVTLYASADANLSNLTKTIQPDAQVFSNQHVVTTMFRADKNSDLKNMIVLATSSVNPFEETLIFNQPYATFLTGTDLDGTKFTKIWDTKTYLNTAAVFSNTVITKYEDTQKTAYLMTGSAGNLKTESTQPSYVIDIGIGSDNNLTYYRNWNYEEDNCQTKNMVAIGSDVFMTAKDPIYQKYQSLTVKTFSEPKTPEDVSAYATKPVEISDKSSFAVNDENYQNKVKEIQDAGQNLYYYMPSLAADSLGNLYMGAADTVYWLHAPSQPSPNNKTSSSLVIGIVLGSLGLCAVGAGIGYYFFKKRKK